MSWYICHAYCRWRSAEEGQHYYLPTEAEWEKAARGTDGRQYPWGNKFDDSRLNSGTGNQVVKFTTPIGIYPNGASPYGCLDMAGNVSEVVEEEKLINSYKGAPADVKAMIDKIKAHQRVIRGGSWYDDAWSCRSAFRAVIWPGVRFSDVGFRLAKSP
jgi:formylglycine-generating enzyme required for sulfatase activity